MKSIFYYAIVLVIITAIIKVGYATLDLAEPTFFWAIAIFMFAVSILVFSTLVVFGHKKPERFVRLVLTSMVVKLIVFAIFVLFMIYLDRENANANIVLFLALYICYTTAEVVLLFKKISASNP